LICFKGFFWMTFVAWVAQFQITHQEAPSLPIAGFGFQKCQ
jgi:hypothetical protein